MTGIEDVRTCINFNKNINRNETTLFMNNLLRKGGSSITSFPNMITNNVNEIKSKIF